MLHRDRTGVGQAVENPQLNATMGHLAHVVRTVDGEVIGAGRLDPLQTGVGPFDRLYETTDGWVCVVAPTDDERRALLETLGVEAVDDDERQGDRLRRGVRDARAPATWSSACAMVGVAAVEPVGRNVHGS